MCGRTSLFTPQSHLEARFDATATQPIEPRYNIAPREKLAVIRNDSPGTIDLLEWGLLPSWADTRSGSQPYRVERTDGEPFAMAGLFERREGERGIEETVAVVTTEPNAVVEPLHHRMAVVLDPEQQQRWLSAADRSVLDTPSAGEWRAYPVSTRVNDPTNDDSGVLEEVEPATQTGLDEFV
ncbi:SOS response-associated peptidase [Halapricum desulfuricans]|uniref:SOS response-associated peptidase YedK n=1 Tax=Halapricum desulfuricans TaxID=2841257 RepID=A0A897NA05_9EURY|nr:SOS response-associated peptidase [Halapricum desulfuricans]QSG07953.1 Putative SOS response-associated peptidase YedK [Halapricum desulfuricans]